MEINLDIDETVFNPAFLPLLNDDTFLQIIFGGAGSGKSKFVAQRAVLDVLAGRNYLVIMKEKISIRDSVYNELLKVITDFNVSKFFDTLVSPTQITCKLNNAQFLFRGLDDPEKLKSITPATGVITDIWIEEATSTYASDIKQIEKRLRGLSKFSKRITMTFNPININHWIYVEYFKCCFVEGMTEFRSEDKVILKTTHEDNNFLTEKDHEKLRNEKDPYFYQVYTLGNFGSPNLEGRVFTGYSGANLADAFDTKLSDYMYIFGGYDRGFTHRAGISVVGITYDFDFHVLEAIGRSQLSFIAMNQDEDSVLGLIRYYQEQYNCHAWFCSHEAVEHISILNKNNIQARSWLSGYKASKSIHDVKENDQTKTNQRLEFVNLLLNEGKMKIASKLTDLLTEVVGLEFKRLPTGGYNRNEVMRVNDDIIDSVTFACGGYSAVRKSALDKMSKKNEARVA